MLDFKEEQEKFVKSILFYGLKEQFVHRPSCAVTNMVNKWISSIIEVSDVHLSQRKAKE